MQKNRELSKAYRLSGPLTKPHRNRSVVRRLVLVVMLAVLGMPWTEVLPVSTAYAREVKVRESHAHGIARVICSKDVYIAVGMSVVFEANGVKFGVTSVQTAHLSTDRPPTLADDQNLRPMDDGSKNFYFDIPIVAKSKGVAGNIPKGTEFRIIGGNSPYIIRVVALETFTGGDDVEPYGFDVVRTTIDISKAGKGRLKLEKASHTPRDEFAGTRVYVPISSGPDIYVKPEGMGKIVFNYYTGSSLRSPLFFGRNDEYKSGDSKQLFFVVKQGRDGARGIVSMVPDTAKLPMKIACDTRTFNSIVLDAEWVFAENSNEQATLSCHVLRKSGRFVVECRWSPKNKAKFIDIAKKEGIVLDQPFELEFEIPQSPVLSEKCRFGFGRYLHLGSRLPPEKSKLGYSRFEVSGQLFLRFGYGLEQDGERFEFTPKEVADQALWGIRNPRWGVESGDWLLSINGKTPETLSEANKMIDDLPFSERIELEIENDRGIKKVLLMDTNPMR